jgi:hypothetical protein
MSRPTTSPRSRRARDDDGSVLAEFALALPILALLVLGILDYGMAWQEGNQVERAASVAARTGSGKATAPEADQDIVLSVASSFNSIDYMELDKIIVYRSTTTDGAVPASCLAVSPSGGGAGINGLCNVYSGAQAASGAGFSVNPGCSGTLDRFWCPSTRDADITGGRDYLGVYIEATYSPLTGIIPGDKIVGRRAVYLLEPESPAGVGV